MFAVVTHCGLSRTEATWACAGESVVDTKDGKTIGLQYIQKGDHVSAAGVPTPDKALVYLGNRITDSDVEVVHDQIGFVTGSFAATANAVRYVGALPVFADVDLQTGNVTAATVQAALTERTVATRGASRNRAISPK